MTARGRTLSWQFLRLVGVFLLAGFITVVSFPLPVAAQVVGQTAFTTGSAYAYDVHPAVAQRATSAAPAATTSFASPRIDALRGERPNAGGPRWSTSPIATSVPQRQELTLGARLRPSVVSFRASGAAATTGFANVCSCGAGDRECLPRRDEHRRGV